MRKGVSKRAVKGSQKQKRGRRAWMSGIIVVLLKPEAVIDPYKNS
jgi:hypothetical protein